MLNGGGLRFPKTIPRETLAFNRSRSVGEEEQMEVVGTYRIRFLLSFFCLSFVFISCFLLSLSFVFL